MPDTRPIERWLPIAALGEESVRERRSMTSLPALNRLRVWWARRRPEISTQQGGRRMPPCPEVDMLSTATR